MNLSVLRVDRFTSPIPISRRCSFVAAVANGNGEGEPVGAPSRSFHHHLLRFHCHFLTWKSLVTTGWGVALENEERAAGDF